MQGGYSAEREAAPGQNLRNILQGFYQSAALVIQSAVKAITYPTCRECGSDDELIRDHVQGDLICPRCGLIAETIIEEKPEWTTFTSASDVCVATNEYPVDSLVSTTLSTSIKAGPNSHTNVARKNQWMYSTTLPYRERVLVAVKKQFEEICEANHLSKAIERRAILLYKQMFDEKNHNGQKLVHRSKKLKGIIGACLYLSISLVQEEGVKRTIPELAKVLNIQTEHIYQAKKEIIASLNLFKDIQQTITHRDLIARFASNLQTGSNCTLPFKLIEAAKSLGDEKTKSAVCHHTPSTVAGACLWYVLVHNTELTKKKTITPAHLTSACGVSFSTIHRFYTGYLR